MVPPNGYPSWADALESGYKITPREKGDLIEMIEHLYEMVSEIHDGFTDGRGTDATAA